MPRATSGISIVRNWARSGWKPRIMKEISPVKLNAPERRATDLGSSLAEALLASEHLRQNMAACLP